MTDEELIEVMARAICECEFTHEPDWIRHTPTGQPSHPVWHEYKPAAHAALTAMREAGYEIVKRQDLDIIDPL